MTRGRPTTVIIALSEPERTTLERWQRRPTLPAGQVRRARMVLLAADGLPLQTIARHIGVAPRFVYKWLRRWQADGIEGLRNKVRTQRIDAAPPSP